MYTRNTTQCRYFYTNALRVYTCMANVEMKETIGILLLRIVISDILESISCRRPSRIVYNHEISLGLQLVVKLRCQISQYAFRGWHSEISTFPAHQHHS